jgi:long-chain acyl-CoA synthetase
MNLEEIIRGRIRKCKNKVAVIYGNRNFTFAELDERVNRLANALIDMGMQAGDRIAIMSRNCPQFREVYISAIKAGLVLVPLNVRHKESEIAYVLDDCKPNAVICQNEYTGLIDSASSGAAYLQNYICIEHAEGKMLSYEDLIDQSQPSEPIVNISEDDLVLLMYTSGTTGQPKGVMTSRRCFTSYITKDPVVYGDVSNSIHMSVMPMHGSAGLMTDFRYFAGGATTVIAESSDPSTVMRLIEQYQVTETDLVPTSINFLLNSPEFGQYDLGSLRKVYYTGSYMAPELLERAIKAMGKIFCQVYGATEAIGISVLKAEEHISGSKRITSAGEVQVGVQMRILDTSGNEVPVGEKGEIVVKSDTLMNGYFGKPEATAMVLENGWFHTGDVGFIDEDGYLYIRDRKKDMIISGGLNIFPAEIENVIISNPAVLEVAVIGVPDPVWGESVKAVVVPKGGAEISDEDIIELCKDKLAGYKKPKSVAFVESLPKTSTGKVQKWVLRKQFE